MDNSIIKKFIGIFSYPEMLDYIKTVKDNYVLTYKNITFNIYYNNINEIDNKLINLVIKRCNIIEPNKKLIINILLAPNKRFIPHNDIIKPVNINGGFTMELNNEIFITRKEEFPKVILHEILHHNININSNYWKKNNIIRLKTHFNIDPSTNLIPNEAIIEFWATIKHLKFVSKDYKLNYNRLLNSEIKYSLFKSYQLLKKQNNKLWREETNAFCYIIFKTIMLVNMEEFYKIYKFPYDEDLITDFLIKFSTSLPLIKKNPTNKRNINSLCMMINSDR